MTKRRDDRRRAERRQTLERKQIRAVKYAERELEVTR